jgi:hypothetical protein
MQIRVSASLNYLDTGGSGSAQQHSCFFLIKVHFEKSRRTFPLFQAGYLLMRQGFGFTKLSGYRRIWIRTAAQLLMRTIFFLIKLHFKKSRRTFYLADEIKPSLDEI